MKKLSFLICALVLLITGCSIQKSTKDSSQVSAYLGDKKIELQQVDVNTDDLIDKAADQDINFDTEKKIFSPLLENKTNAKFDDEISIKFDKKYDNAIVFDHLLNEDGHSFFNKSINQYDLKIDNNTASIKLSEHPALALSSDSSFLANQETRGFRIVLKDSDKTYEYAFIINIKK